MKLAAKIFSILFHPLFHPLIALPIYFSVGSYQNLILAQADDQFLYAIYSVMVSVGVLFPLLSLYIMTRTGLLSDFNAYHQKERPPIFFIVLIYYLMVYFMYRSWNNSIYHLLDPLLSFLTGGIVLMGGCFLINFKWKISLHSTAISALSAAFLAFSMTLGELENPIFLLVVNVLLIFLIGLVSSSRLILKAHLKHEVYLGIILGFFVEFIVVYLNISF